MIPESSELFRYTSLEQVTRSPQRLRRILGRNCQSGTRLPQLALMPFASRIHAQIVAAFGAALARTPRRELLETHSCMGMFANEKDDRGGLSGESLAPLVGRDLGN